MKSNLILTDDIVFNYAHILSLQFNEYQKKDRYILFSWRDLHNFVSKDKEIGMIERFVGILIDTAKCMCVNKFLALPIDVKTDVEINKLIIDRLKELGYDGDVIIPKNIEESVDTISNAVFFYSGRLHSTMIAEAMKIPTFSMIYSPKMKYYYDSINKKSSCVNRI